MNPMKKVKIANSSASKSCENADGLDSGEKMIARLNHDCLARVLMYISILERLEMENVCQKWREAAGFSWYNVKKLNLNNLMIRFDEKEEILEKIMKRCCRYLTHLTIDESHSWLADILKDNCHKMIHFDIEGDDECPTEIPNDKLVGIFKSMSQLKYLKVSISDSGNYKKTLLDKILQVLPGDIEEIHVIVSDGWYLHPKVLLDKFHNLHCLTLQEITLREEALESIITNKNILTRLDLSWCQFPSGELQVFSNLKNLEQLILQEVSDFNENTLTLIARNCSKLNHLQITRVCDEYDGMLPYRIFRELRYLNLEYLECDEVDGPKHIMSGLGNNWKNLKYLDIGGGWSFSLRDFQEITKFKNLEYLMIYKATSFNSKSIINITNNCLALKKICMNCHKLPMSETAIASFTNLKQLEQFTFPNSDDIITGNLLSKIVNNCHNLVDLDLSLCKNVTEASLVEVGKLEHLKKLVLLDIINVPNEMFNNLRKLEYLSCNGCPSVTDENIIKVLDNCKKLSHLNVRGTGITVKSLVYAVNREYACTKLQIHADRPVRHAFRANYSTISPLTELK